jgi:hypothetical protein
MRETSIEAYNQIKAAELLSQKRWEVYDILFHRGPLTAGEVFLVGKELGYSHMKNNISTRLTELRNLGVVKECGERECTLTKKNVILWDVTADLPRDSAELLKLQGNIRPTRSQLEKKILLYRKLVLGVRRYLNDKNDVKAVERLDLRVSEIDGI